MSFGFSPPTSAQDAEASTTALPVVALPSSPSLPSLAVVLDKTQGSVPGLASNAQAFSAQEPLPEHAASTAFAPSLASKTRTETMTMSHVTIRDDELERIEEIPPLHRFQPQMG